MSYEGKELFNIYTNFKVSHFSSEVVKNVEC